MYSKEIKSKIHKKSYISTSPLNITIGSDMPITLLHLMRMSKIYVVNSDMKITSILIIFGPPPCNMRSLFNELPLLSLKNVLEIGGVCIKYHGT